MKDDEMSIQYPTSVLKHARSQAGLTQTTLAERLKVTPTIVSRLEATELADDHMAKRYLNAINTELASKIIEFYSTDWSFIERPDFLHPEHEVLWKAELALQALNNFEKSDQFDPVLRDALTRARHRIVTEAEFIKQREHGIAFIGDIGAGKTTALSYVTNLIHEKSGVMESIFPTGSGRTTVCEVAVKIAPTFGIAVDCLDENEIRRLVSDLVNSLKSGKGGLPTELDRVIRNMAGLRRVSTRAVLPDSKPTQVDQMKVLIEKFEDMDQAIAEIISRMKLVGRKESQMLLPENAEGNLEWLSANISKINFGQHPNFSVPQRITVLLPLEALRETPYRISVIDTKGVDGTTQRPDLKVQLDDPRTLTVLCCKFSDAPGSTPVAIMKELLESGSDSIKGERICLLVLPRDNEAIKIVDDSGNNPVDAEEGYAVRHGQIEQQFAAEALPMIPINFYNTHSDAANAAWSWLTRRLDIIRVNKIAKLERHIDSAFDLISNSDSAKTIEARRTLFSNMKKGLPNFSELSLGVRPAFMNLVEQTKRSHQSSIAASVLRRGQWENFPIPHILGVGVGTDANFRSIELFVRIKHQLFLNQEEFKGLEDIRQFIEGLDDDLEDWKQEFLQRAQLIGRLTYSPYLETADDLWNECDDRYGEGSGYRNDIAKILQDHFETDEGAKTAAAKIEVALKKLWEELVIQPLMAALNYPDENSD